MFSVSLDANEEMSIRLFWASITTNTAQSIDVDAEDCRLRFLSYQGASNTGSVVPQSMGDESVGEWLGGIDEAIQPDAQCRQQHQDCHL